MGLAAVPAVGHGDPATLNPVSIPHLQWCVSSLPRMFCCWHISIQYTVIHVDICFPVMRDRSGNSVETAIGKRFARRIAENRCTNKPFRREMFFMKKTLTSAPDCTL